MKRIISLFLSLIMLMSTLITVNIGSVTAHAAGYKNGDIIEFGYYPQSRVTDNSIYDEVLSKLKDENKRYYKYYLPDSNAVGTSQQDYILFADVDINGSRYRYVSMRQERPINNKWGKGFVKEPKRTYKKGGYIFKYEPIKWRVLDASKGLVISESILDSQTFNNTAINLNNTWYKNENLTGYSYDYASSSIRQWANYDFLRTAFDHRQFDYIIPTVQKNWNGYSKNTNAVCDRILLPDYATLTNTAYGFNGYYLNVDSKRAATCTDYAACQHGSDMNEYWTLSFMYGTGGDADRDIGTVGTDGHMYYDSYDFRQTDSSDGSMPYTVYSPLVMSNQGFRPVCYLDLDNLSNTGVPFDYRFSESYGYGSYPQTQITDEDLKESLDATSKTFKSYGYYKTEGGAESPVSGNCMNYADFFYQGTKYRAVKYIDERPIVTSRSDSSSHLGENGFYDDGGTYYFKYEPISWVPLDSEAGKFIAYDVLDSQPFNEFNYQDDNTLSTNTVFKNVDANDYERSSVKRWINDTFKWTAFTKTQRNGISSIELPTKEDADNYINEFGTNTSTPYALSQGLSKNLKTVILSDADDSYRNPNRVYGFKFESPRNRGTVGGINVNNTDYGIRPVVYFDAAKDDLDITNRKDSEYRRIYLGIEKDCENDNAGDINKAYLEYNTQKPDQYEGGVSVQANPPYIIAGWYRDGIKYNSVDTYITNEHIKSLDNDIYLEAAFANTSIVNIYVQINNENVGTVSGDGQYSIGETANLSTTKTDNNYSFVGWYRGNTLVSTSPNYSFTVDKGGTYKAVYERKKVTVKVITQADDRIKNNCLVSIGGSAAVGDSLVEIENGWQLEATSGKILYLSALTNSAAAKFSAYKKGSSVISTESTLSLPISDSDSDIVITAVFEPVTHHVGISVVGNGKVNGKDVIAEDYWIISGQDIEYTAQAAAGSKFVGWYDNNGRFLSDNPTYTVSSVIIRNLESTYIQARFKPEGKFTVNVLIQGEGNISPPSIIESEYGNQASLTATPSYGYEFAGWYDETGQYLIEYPSNNPLIFDVTDNITITAKFVKSKYTITLDTETTDGGFGGTVSGGGTYDYDTELRLKATPESGYKFLGWFRNDGNPDSAYDDSELDYTVEGNETLIAKFAPVKYNNITVTVEGNGTVTGGGRYSEFDNWVVLESEYDNNILFLGFYDDGGNLIDTDKTVDGVFVRVGDDWIAFNSTKDMHFTAKFREKRQFTTAFDTYGNGKLKVNGNSGIMALNTAEGDEIILEPVADKSPSPNTYYYSFDKFVNQYGTEIAGIKNNWNGTYTYTPTSNEQVFAQFVKVDNTDPFIYITVEGNGDVQLLDWYATCYQVDSDADNQVVYRYNGEGSLGTSFTPAEGFNFEGLYDKATGALIFDSAGAGRIYVDGTSNYELIAKFAADTNAEFTINASASGRGTVTGGGTYKNGTSVTLTAIANSDAEFAGWYENGSKINNNAVYTFNVSSNRNIIAQFNSLPEKYTVSLKTTEGGSVKGGGTYEKNMNAYIYAYPDDGYLFKAWKDSSGVISDKSSHSFRVNKDAVLTAEFEKIDKMNVTVETTNFNGVGSGTASGGGSYNYDSVVTVTAAPDAGSQFAGWYGWEGDLVSNDLSYTFNTKTYVWKVGKNIPLFAVFVDESLKNYKVEVKPIGDGSGTVYGSGYYPQGTTIWLGAVPVEDSYFNYWYCDNEKIGYGNWKTVVVNDDDTYYAEFIKFSPENIKYNINLKTIGNGSVIGGVQSYNGTTTTVKAIPEDGNKFLGWYDGSTLVSKDASYSFTVSKSNIYTAKFAPDSYKLSVNKTGTGSGTVSGAGAYAPGKNVTVKAAPSADSSFDGWYNGNTLVSKNASYTFTVNSNLTLTAKFTKLPPINDMSGGATENQVEKFVTTLPNDCDPKGTKFSYLLGRQKKVSKSAVTITWQKPAGAAYFIVYGNKCGNANKYKKIAKVTSNTYTQKGLKKGTYYKYLICAFDKNGKLLGTTNTIHIATKGGKKGNYKSVTTKAKKNKVSLKKGKSFKLKAKAVKEKGVKKVSNHRAIRYETSNAKVATVSAKGVIKGKKKGTAYVFAYAQNGVYKKIKVTVK